MNKVRLAPWRFDPSRDSTRLYLDILLPLENSVGLCTRKLRINNFARWQNLEARTVNESGEDHCGLRVNDYDGEDES